MKIIKLLQIYEIRFTIRKMKLFNNIKKQNN